MIQWTLRGFSGKKRFTPGDVPYKGGYWRERVERQPE